LYDGTSRARIVATLREWLVGEFRATYDGMDRDFSSKSMWGGMVKLPQQPNFTDCGLYVMHYFEQFFKVCFFNYYYYFFLFVKSKYYFYLFLVSNCGL